MDFRKSLGIDAFVSLWIGIWLGIGFGLYPYSIGIWIVLSLLLFVSRERKIFFVAVLLGLFRIGFFLLAPEFPNLEIQKILSENHHFRIQIADQQNFSSNAKILEIDSKPVLEKNWSVSLSEDQKSKPGEVLEGDAKIHSLGTYEPILFEVPKERLWQKDNTIGRLKFSATPLKISKHLSLDLYLRSKIVSFLRSSHFKNLESFRKAIFIGDPSELDSSLRKDMGELGLSHLLIVSGAHLAFLLFLFYMLSRKSPFRISRKSPFLLRVASFLLISLFLFILGPHRSLLRAYFCLSIYLTVGWFWPAIYRYSKFQILGAAGALFLAIDPLSAVEPAYILSFGISLAVYSLHDWKISFRPFLRYFWVPFLLIYPLCKVFCFPISLFSPLINFMVFPIYLFLAFCSLLSCFFRSLEPLTAHLVGFFFESIHDLALALRFPIYSHLPPKVWVFISLVIALGFLYQARNLFEERLRIGVLVAIFVSAVSLDLVLPKLTGSSTLSVFNVDIGQGDGFILQMEDLSILIDGGSRAPAAHQLLPAVLNESQNHIDLWILTHFDEDHRGGFDEIHSLVSVKEIWIPHRDHSTFSARLQDQMPLKEIAKGGRELCSKHFCLKSWMDPRRSRLLQTDIKNEDGVGAILYEKANRRTIAIFLADLPGEQEKALLRSQEFKDSTADGLELLKVAHHGSETSSTAELLAVLKPKWILISSGRQNRFHFPRPEVLRRLELWSSSISRTDILGNFKLYFDF